MTTRDAELFGMLAGGLIDDERWQGAEAVTGPTPGRKIRAQL